MERSNWVKKAFIIRRNGGKLPRPLYKNIYKNQYGLFCHVKGRAYGIDICASCNGYDYYNIKGIL